MLFKIAFERISDLNNEVTQSDVPELLFNVLDEGATLTMILSIGAVWKPRIVFKLPSMNLDKNAILEARLRDAQDEIERLKSRMPTFLSIGSKEPDWAHLRD
jgi:hypothetical protein